MTSHADLSRDLRLGLRAFESGIVDRQQLLAAIRDWTESPERSLADVLAGRGWIDAPTLARLEGPDDPNPTDSRAEPAAPPVAETVDHVGAGPGDPPRASDEERRFRILRPHARGGLGEVFLALDRELNRTVALKELQARLAHDPGAQARFLQEAKVTGRLEHPGIVPVYSLGRYPDGRPFYAMHLVQGETLRSAIERFHRTGRGGTPREGRALSFRRLLRSLIDACNAVAFAHSRHVVHRDLKPENIMLGRFGETLVVDWGVAKILAEETVESDRPSEEKWPQADASMTQPGAVVGTPRFMSPEQAAGDLDRVGPASDIYSLGAILYCILVGHAPVPEGDLPTVLDRIRRGIFPAPRRVKRTVDPMLESICMKALALSPSERHASALDLASALESWLADVRYRGEQETALSQARSTLARLCLERAHQSFHQDQHSPGMLWMARALEHAPQDPPELERLIRTSLRGWHLGPKLLERSLRHGCEVLAVAFSPDGRRLATACADASARLWDVSRASALTAPLMHEAPVRSVVFSPDGTRVATTCDDGTIQRWDALTGESLGEPIRCGITVRSLQISPDGARIAAAAGPGVPFLWDAATGRAILDATARTKAAAAVAFSPDGTIVAVAHDGEGVCFRESATGKPIGEPLDLHSKVCVLSFGAGGQSLLTGSLEGGLQLWDMARRASLLSLNLPASIRCAWFRPGDEVFATVCDDGSARLWDSATGRPIGEPLDPASQVECLAFQPDGRLLATGSSEGMVRF